MVQALMASIGVSSMRHNHRSYRTLTSSLQSVSFQSCWVRFMKSELGQSIIRNHRSSGIFQQALFYTPVIKEETFIRNASSKIWPENYENGSRFGLYNSRFLRSSLETIPKTSWIITRGFKSRATLTRERNTQWLLKNQNVLKDSENQSTENGDQQNDSRSISNKISELSKIKHEKKMKKLAVIRETSSLIYNILSIFFMLAVVIYLLDFNILSSNAIVADDVSVTFDDVKGTDTAKQELQEIVEFLREPEKFSFLGGKLPKGVLLVGPPGTGKTLLAKAVAGEAGVPFFSVPGSQFDEKWVGQGARRVRNLFQLARTNAPCVIFIDEIDSVGSHRVSSEHHPYANQTLNQLLTEMDGFLPSEGVIVIGATNRHEDLDKALLRPGRFDVSVRVDVPDIGGRRDLLKYYLSKIKRGLDIDEEYLARGTIGFTGADIENMVNQAAIRAAVEGKDAVSMADLDFARDKVIMGPEQKSRIPDKELSLMVAFHEGGHALVSHYTKNSKPLHKITIIPRGQSLGHTAFMPKNDQKLVKKCQLLADLDGLMGGRAAEELIFGSDNVTAGACSDFQMATSLAKKMVEEFGLSDSIGPRTFRSNPYERIADSTNDAIDQEIKRILNESMSRAKSILKAHEKELRLLADALMQHETLDGDQLKSLLETGSLNNRPHKPQTPKPKEITSIEVKVLN